jgi:putative zincin peptidase
MKVLLGSIPEIAGFDPETAGLHKIGGPGATISQLLASLIGLFLLVVPIAGLCLILSIFAIPNPDADPNYTPPVAWGAAVLAMLSFIPLHELLHLIWHPRFGRSDRSILVIWPIKLLFGVYYEGCMSRTRWLLMRIAPFVFLSILPAIFIALFQYVAFSHMSKTYLEVLMVLNTVGSGADVAAIFLVVSQVPRSASLCFRGGKAYWQQAIAVSTASSATDPD